MDLLVFGDPFSDELPCFLGARVMGVLGEGCQVGVGRGRSEASERPYQGLSKAQGVFRAEQLPSNYRVRVLSECLA